MSAQELAIWSMALGAVAAVALARLADLLVRPSLSQSQGVAYHVTVFLLVLILSGVAGQLWPTLSARLMQPAQVLAGPVCVGLSNFWIRGWLDAAQRDRVMASVLRAGALLLPLAGIGCLALPAGQQLPAAAALSLIGAVLTKLYSAISLVKKLIKAQRRRRRTRRDGAVLAILVFDVERIAAQAGTTGVNEMFICLAGRIQRQVGVVNPVGRYYERCFVSLVETIQSPAWLRTLGLRVASNLRRPMQVTTASGP